MVMTDALKYTVVGQVRQRDYKDFLASTAEPSKHCPLHVCVLGSIICIL